MHFLIVCGDADRDAAESKVDDISSRLGISSKRAVITGENVDREVVRYVADSNADAVFVNAQREIGGVADLRRGGGKRTGDGESLEDRLRLRLAKDQELTRAIHEL